MISKINSNDLEEIIVSVVAPQKVEEDLATTVEEDVSKVEKVEKEKKEDDIVPEIKESKK